ncbi:hypothetical protein TWF281_003209 [Arthrobotrys megalospora]
MESRSSTPKDADQERITVIDESTNDLILDAGMGKSGEILLLDHAPSNHETVEEVQKKQLPRQLEWDELLVPLSINPTGEPLKFTAIHPAKDIVQKSLLAKLPDELVVHQIIPYLVAGDLVSLSQTCIRFFNIIAYDQKLWHKKFGSVGHELAPKDTLFSERVHYYKHAVEIAMGVDDFDYIVCQQCFTTHKVKHVFDGSEDLIALCTMCTLDKFGGENIIHFHVSISMIDRHGGYWCDYLMRWTRAGHLKRGMVLKLEFDHRDYGILVKEKSYRRLKKGEYELFIPDAFFPRRGLH